MPKRLVAALLLSAFPLVTAFEDPPGAPEPVDVGFVVKDTDFFVVNYSTEPQVLFFRAGDFVTWRVVPAGGMFSSTYTRAALEGVRMEVARRETGLWMTSGSFDLAELVDSGTDAVWVQRGTSPAAWRDLAGILSLITTDPTELPEWLPMPALGESTPPLPPMSIPVVTPVEREEEEVPPGLGDRPQIPG